MKKVVPPCPNNCPIRSTEPRIYATIAADYLRRSRSTTKYSGGQCDVTNYKEFYITDNLPNKYP